MNTNKNKFRQPSLRSLEIFEVAARHQGFTPAADELCITQSAVSRQVNELEQTLGAKLFIRHGPNLKVTETGKQLATSVQAALNLLREAVQSARPMAENNPIFLSMMPSLATMWFAPRLGEFMQSHPDIALRVAATRELVTNFEADEIDAAIRYGDGNWPDLNVELLSQETIMPVCTLEYAKRIGLNQPCDLDKATLLQTELPENWSTWFKAAGLEALEKQVQIGPHIGDAAAQMQVALEGQGVALGRSVLLADNLRTGKLIAPYQINLKSSYSYWLVLPSYKRTNPQLDAVREWLIQSFSQSN